MLLFKLVRFIIRNIAKLSSTGFKTGPNGTRYSAYRHLRKHRKKRDPNLKVLSISGSQAMCKNLGFTDEQITNVEYPDVNMLDLPFGDGEFDAVVSDQVLEHVEGNPYDAVKESLRVLKPGGLCLHATCLLVPVHGAPSDFWRFTPEALRLLTEEQTEIIETGGWGNPVYLFLADLGLRFVPIPHAKWHPLHWIASWNHSDWPLFTWVVCEKK